MSNTKQPGQRAHDVYYSALDGAARNWEMGLDRERSAWAAVELAEWRNPRTEASEEDEAMTKMAQEQIADIRRALRTVPSPYRKEE